MNQARNNITKLNFYVFFFSVEKRTYLKDQQRKE